MKHMGWSDGRTRYGLEWWSHEAVGWQGRMQTLRHNGEADCNVSARCGRKMGRSTHLL